jgi:hypothetical protein
MNMLFSLSFYKVTDTLVTDNLDSDVYYLHQQTDPEVEPSFSLLSEYSTWPLF